MYLEVSVYTELGNNPKRKYTVPLHHAEMANEVHSKKVTIQREHSARWEYCEVRTKSGEPEEQVPTGS